MILRDCSTRVSKVDFTFRLRINLYNPILFFIFIITIIIISEMKHCKEKCLKNLANKWLVRMTRLFAQP
jgi:hypothetical protein